jgi:hypothetical protein
MHHVLVRRIARAALGWLAVVSSTGCLPTGDPPAGRQVLADRTSQLIAALPVASPPDATLRLLVTRPVEDPQSPFKYGNLYLVSVPDAGGAPSEQLLLERFAAYGFPYCEIGFCLPTDARGRLFLSTDYDPSTAQSRLVRIDVTTGDRLDLGWASYYLSSPSLTRTAAIDYVAFTITLLEIDDRTTVITDVAFGQPGFVGEDFYYVAAGGRLRRVPPGAQPETVRDGVVAFQSRATTNGPVVILMLGEDFSSLGTLSLLDPATLQERPLAIDAERAINNGYDLSSDGRWLLVRGQGELIGQRFTLVDVATEAEENFETPGPTYQGQWRPGRAEIWLSGADYGDGQAPATWIKRPGQPLVTVAPVAGGRTGAIFSADGTYWFSTEVSDVKGRTEIFVGLADDPTAPRVRLNPEGSDSYDVRQVADGRFLVEAFYTTDARSDIYLVDPDTGESRLLGERGNMMTIGPRRLLAQLRSVDGAGDLAVLDFDGGGSTLLATEFAGAALPEPRGSDLLGPGSRVAFQFRARFASPYDGIWVATLP